MVRLRALAADIDGTLTVDRGVFTLDLEVAGMLRELRRRGVHIILVTGNSVPVVAGLARYLGFEDSPQVAENGCMVFYRGVRLRTCMEDVTAAAKLVEEKLSHLVYPSWQNVYRHCDYAFNIKASVDAHNVLLEVKRLLETHEFTNVSIGFSGYAIHVRPRCASKAGGLRKAIDLIGVKKEEVVAVGDSSMDAELKSAVGFLAAVGNADKELKKNADVVLPGKSASSVKMLIETLLEAGLEIEEALEKLKTLQTFEH